MNIGEVCLIEAEDATIPVDLYVDSKHIYKMNIISDFPYYSWGFSDTYIKLFPNNSEYSSNSFFTNIINYPTYTRSF